MDLTGSQATLVAAAIAAVSAIVVAVMSAYLGRVFSGRDRRRQMYGEAFRVALEWREMLYRVRRRDNTDEGCRALVERFHDLQEKIDFYEGWIGSESKYMRRSYRRFVQAVKEAVISEIRDAWEKPGSIGNAEPGDKHPVVNQNVVNLYLKDVRGHLSFQPSRWIAVIVRNWSDK